MSSVSLYVVFHLIGSLLAVGYLWQMLYSIRKELLNRIAASFLLALFLSWVIIGIGFYNMANRKPYIKRNSKPKTKQS